MTKCRAKDPSSCRIHGTHGLLNITDVFTRFDSHKPLPVDITHIDFSKAAKDAFSSLLPDEKFYLYKYSDRSGSIAINRALDNGNELTLEQKGFVSNLDSAIQKSEPETKRNLYRGTGDSNRWNSVTIGEEVEYKGFLSTSSDAYEASKFMSKSSPVLLKMSAKGGLPVQTHAEEYEYLLARGKKFKVVSVENKKTLAVSKTKTISTQPDSIISLKNLKLITLEEI